MLARFASRYAARASPAAAPAVVGPPGPTPTSSAAVGAISGGRAALSSVRRSSEKKEIVTFLKLNNISDNPGAVKQRRRIGRGIGCSKGKTSGRGHKGQNARSGGGVRPFFEGGQTPLHKRLPKRGFTNVHAEPMTQVNVGAIQDHIDMGRLVPPGPGDPPLTIRDFIDAGIIKKSTVKHGVKLLAKGRERLRSPLRIEVSRASRSAIDAVEGAGGEIATVHYNQLALKALIKPERFEVIPRRALPPTKLLPYYTSYENRGYLSPEVQMRMVRARMGGGAPMEGQDEEVGEAEAEAEEGEEEAEAEEEEVEAPSEGGKDAPQSEAEEEGGKDGKGGK